MSQTVDILTGPAGVGQKFSIGPVTATKNGQTASLPGPVLASVSGDPVVTIEPGLLPDSFEAVSVDEEVAGQAIILIESGLLSDTIQVNATAGTVAGDTLVVPLGPVELK